MKLMTAGAQGMDTSTDHCFFGNSKYNAVFLMVRSLFCFRVLEGWLWFM
jgi:hypothetical protein